MAMKIKPISANRILANHNNQRSAVFTIGSHGSRSAETLCDFRAAQGVVPNVPAIDGFCLGFDGAMRKHGVVDSSAYYPQGRRCLQCIRVFIAGKRDDREPLPYAADKEHCLFAA